MSASNKFHNKLSLNDSTGLSFKDEEAHGMFTEKRASLISGL